MQRDYTQKTQSVAQDRRDAANWRMIESNPELSRLVVNAVQKMDQGLPLEQANSGSKPIEEIDPSDDPQAYLTSIIDDRLNRALQPLIQQMGGVANYVNTNQRDLEWQNLANKYPAAKTLSMDEVNAVRLQYRNADGTPISMEKAFALLAADRPEFLRTADQIKTKPTDKKPRVERPASRSAESTKPVEVPSGVKALQKEVMEDAKKGRLSLAGAMDKLYDLIGNR